MSEGGADKDSFKLYRYDPSLAGNIILLSVFALAAIGHVVLLVRNRTWYFIPFVIGCIFEAVGYVGRVLAATENPNFTLSLYVMQTLLILLGPALLAASIYMILGRLIRQLGAEQYALIRPTWTTKIFVTGDVVSFLAQGAGGGIISQAKTKENQKLGEGVILGGLGIQILFFGFFIITTIVFHVRMIKNPTPRSYSVTGPWKQLIMALYISSVLVMIRSVFRMVEFGMGNDSVFMSQEGYLLGLDGALMFIAAAVFLWCHPSRALKGYKDVFIEADSESGRNTAESLRMLSVHADTQTAGRKASPSRYDSDSTAMAGQYAYGYDASPRANRYSTAYER